MVIEKGKIKSWLIECSKSEGQGLGGAGLRLTPEATHANIFKICGS